MTCEHEPHLDRRLRDGLGDVGRAFFDFPELSEVQRAAIPLIAEGRNVLVCAATATGKTEAVIAPIVWRLRKNAARREAGLRLLAIAPTRALVADLVARLQLPLAQLGWRCAAQTSDFRGKATEPEVLVTTPESLDSMLVRDLRQNQGEAVGHLLANVGAVFIDEAHCFDASARGDQVTFLLTRLCRLRESAVARRWAKDAVVHLCAASATVPTPEWLGSHLLGPGSQVVSCPGGRAIEILTEAGTWHRLQADHGPAEVAMLLPSAPDMETVSDCLWQGMKSAECRKALVFAPSRRQCDLLSRELRRRLLPRRALWVGAHHGSLARKERQDAETAFHQNRDSILVATNTLEVGIDIGDVDIVVLIGAPPDTSSLLQRIGRGGRRSGLTRVLAVARHAADRAALASQLTAAAAGVLDAKYRFPRWDVFPQQVISYIRQNRELGRPTSSLCDLAAAVWPSADTRPKAEELVRYWLRDGYLVEQRGRLHLGSNWGHFAAHADGDFLMHSNIRAGAVGTAIRDNRSGEVIGHVGSLDETSSTVTIAGRRHRIVAAGEEILVAPVGDADADERDDTPRYAARRRPISEAYAGHVRRGLGFGACDAPVLHTTSGLVWFHFGGELFETCLRITHSECIAAPVIPGIAVKVYNKVPKLNLNQTTRGLIRAEESRLVLTALNSEGAGRFAEQVPESMWGELGDELHLPTRYEQWLESRHCIVFPCDSEQLNLHEVLSLCSIVAYS